MTRHWPDSKNSFHAAWLLLILPPLLSVLISAGSAYVALQGEQFVRLALALLVTAPLVWWRASDTHAGTRRLLKELRIQMPGFLVAMGVPGLLGLGTPADLSEWSFISYAFGCGLLGATAFGVEYEHRTLAGLLSQPRMRWALYFDKLIVLGALLGLAAVNQLALQSGVRSSDSQLILLVPAFAFCSGPLFSLLSRSTLAGLVFTGAVPLLLTLLAALTMDALVRWAPVLESAVNPLASGFPTWGSSIYLTTTFLLGWRQFKHLEVRDSGAGGKSISSLHPLSHPVDWVMSRLLPLNGAAAQLLRKELRLQVIPWFVAGIMIGIWLLWIALGWSRTAPPEFRALDQVSGATLVAGLLGVLLILGTGAASIAEERELGTLEWQLTQPTSIRQQWWTKVAVTGVLTLGFGLGLPWFLLRLWFGAETLYEGWNHPGIPEISGFLGGSILLLALSLYASSISRNTMGAVATTVGLGAGLGAIGSLCAFTLGRWMDEGFQSNFADLDAGPLAEVTGWIPTQRQIQTIALVAATGLGVLIVGTLLGLAAGHFRRARTQSGRVTSELGFLAMGLVVLSLLSGLVVIRLAQRSHRADMVRFQREQQESLVVELENWIRAEPLPAAIYHHFGIPENTPASELVSTIANRGGNAAVRDILTVLRARRNNGQNTHYLNELASRYGLPVLDAPTNRFVRPPTLPRQSRP